MAASWYVLRSKSGKEEAVWRHVRDHEQLNAYYPHYYQNRVVRGQRKFLPLFPGYLFVEADLAEKGQYYFDRMINAIGLASNIRRSRPLGCLVSVGYMNIPPLVRMRNTSATIEATQRMLKSLPRAPDLPARHSLM